MRAVLVTVIMMLTLVPGHWPVLASARVGTPALDSIHMVDALAGWAVTVTREPSANELLSTTDGGLQWTDVTPLNSSRRKIRVGHLAVLNSLIAWVESDEPVQIFHTVDGGRTWRSPTPVPVFQAYGNPTPYSIGGTLHFVDTRNGWLMIGVGAAGSMEVDVHRTTDGGHTWVKVAHTTTGNERSGLPFGGDKDGITFLNTTTGWITGYDVGCPGAYLFVTHDGGRTWRDQKLPGPSEVTIHSNGYWHESTQPPVFFSARDGVLPTTLYYSVMSRCSGDKSVVVFYVTHDGGATWIYTTPVAGNGTSPSSFADVNHGWVSEGNLLYQTKDGGQWWTTIPLPPAFADIKQLDFISPQVGWAVRRASPFLLKTLDGGHTWAPVP